MKKNEKVTLKRFLAYLVDVFIITAVSTLFSNIELINPLLEKYENAYERYTNYISSLSDISELLTSETLSNYTYDIAYYGVITSIITLIITILYYVIFQYYNKGKTIGKAIMKIKVVDEKGNKPSMIQFLLRSIIINSLLTNLLSCIFIAYMSEDNYLLYSPFIEYLDMALLFVSYGMILLRKDGRGLHDLFGKTKVVSDEKEIKYTEKKVKEEKLIEDDEINEKIENLVNKTNGKKSKNENSNRK